MKLALALAALLLWLLLPVAPARADGINNPFPDGIRGNLGSDGINTAGSAPTPIVPPATTAFTATGPATGITALPSSAFTVTLVPAGAIFSGTQSITIGDGAGGGTFTPSVGAPGVSTVTVTPTIGVSAFTFTYAAATNGAHTLTFTNAQTWTNAGPLTYTTTTVPTGFTATGPATGTAGAPSSNFTVTLTPAGATFNGTASITLSDLSSAGGGGGTFTPSVGAPGAGSVTVTPAAAAASFTFTYTGAVSGVYTLSFTNAQGWSNAPNLTYTIPSGPPPCTNSLDFSQACNSQYIGAIL